MKYAPLLALLLVATPAQADDWVWPRHGNTEKSVKHMGTGFAIGAGGMGFCTETTNRITGKHQTLYCYAGTLLVGAAFYYYKEGIYDRDHYGHGKTVSGRDFAEGVGFLGLGAGVLVPIVGW